MKGIHKHLVCLFGYTMISHLKITHVYNNTVECGLVDNSFFPSAAHLGICPMLSEVKGFNYNSIKHTQKCNTIIIVMAKGLRSNRNTLVVLQFGSVATGVWLDVLMYAFIFHHSRIEFLNLSHLHVSAYYNVH